MSAQAGPSPTGQSVNKLEISLGQTLLQAKLLTPAQLSQAMWEKTETSLQLTEICLQNDWISYAELYTYVSTDQLRLGEILMLYGYLSVEQLREVLHIQQQNPGQSLGDELIRQGWVKPEDLDWAVAEQQILREIAQPDAWQTIQQRLARDQDRPQAVDEDSIVLDAGSVEAGDDLFSFNPIHLGDGDEQDSESPPDRHPSPDPPEPAVEATSPSPPNYDGTDDEPAFLEDPQVTQKISQLRQQVVTLEERIQTQQHQHHQETTETDQLIQQLKSQIQQREQELEDTVTERAQLREQLAEAARRSDEHLSLQQQLQTLQAEHDQRTSELQEAREQLQTRKTQMEEQLQLARQAIKKFHAQLQQKTQEQTQSQAQIEQYQQQQQQMQSQVDRVPQLEEQIAHLTQQLVQNQSDLQHHQIRHEQDQGRIQQLEQHIQAQQEIQRSVQTKSRKTIEQFEEQVRSLTQQLQDAQQAFQTSQDYLNQQQARMEQILTEKEQAIEEHLQAQQQANQLEHTCQVQQHQIQTQTEQLTILRTQLVQEQQHSQSVSEHLQDLQQQWNQVQSQESSNTERIDSLLSQLQEFQALTTAQTEQIEVLERQLQQVGTDGAKSHRRKGKGRPLKQPKPVQPSSITEEIAEAWGLGSADLSSPFLDSNAEHSQTPDLFMGGDVDVVPPPGPDPCGHLEVPPEPTPDATLEDLFRSDLFPDASEVSPSTSVDMSSTAAPPTGELTDPLTEADSELSLEEMFFQDPFSTMDTALVAEPDESTAEFWEELVDEWNHGAVKPIELDEDKGDEFLEPTQVDPSVQYVIDQLQSAALISEQDVEKSRLQWKQTGGAFIEVLAQYAELKPETIEFFNEGGYSMPLEYTNQIGDYLQAAGLVSLEQIRAALPHTDSETTLLQVLVRQGIIRSETADYFQQAYGAEP